MCNDRNNRGPTFANIYLLSENEIKFTHLNTGKTLLLIQKFLIPQKLIIINYLLSLMPRLCLCMIPELNDLIPG